MRTGRGQKPYLITDVETNGLIYDTLYCVGFAEEDGETFHIVLNWRLLPYGQQNFVETEEFKTIQGILERHYIVFHNAFYDLAVLSSFGFDLSKIEFDDTMIMSYILYPLRPEGHSLRAWGEMLNYQKDTHEDFTEYTPQMGSYCERDCSVTQQVHGILLEELQKDTRAFKLYEEVEIPMVLATLILEENGVLVDVNTWENQTVELEKEQARVLEELRNLVPYAPGTSSKVKNPRPDHMVFTPQSLDDLKHCHDQFYPLGQDEEGRYLYKKFVPFNPDSNNQIIWVLETFYNWKPTEFTPNGNPKCDADTLDNLDNQFATALTQYATVAKLTGTYGRAFLNNVKSDGRIHARFNACVTATGRYSSSEPNLQNIPTKGETGETIRASFIPRDGFKFIGIDCSQFQVRILAYYLLAFFGDTPEGRALSDEFNTKDDADPHQVVADLLKIPRKAAKNCMFGNIFGFGAEKLAKMIGVSIPEAQAYVKALREFFPVLPKLKELIWDECRRNNGVIHDLYGRRGVYPDINSKDKQAKVRAERQSFNFIIQATEASIMKMCMLQAIVAGWLAGANIVLQVHDELIFECPEETCQEFAEDLEYIFSKDWLPGVKMVGKAQIGMNWKESH